MKNKFAATAAVVFVLATGIVAAPPSHASHTNVSFDFFYSDLSPHGSWLVSGQYGRVWQPRVYTRGWNPYYDGHWQYADVGWVWVSDYSWGATPYHYGTWVEDPRFGWVWVPGYTWAPAWVVFRTGYDAIGWAPVAPGFSVGVSLDFGAPVSSSFIFVSTRDFAAPRIRPYVVNDYRRTTYINNTTIINNLTIQNNVVVNRGPDVRVVERATGRRLKAAPVETVARVAPFQGVRREQLAVAPDRVSRGARATEPVSAKRPLPQISDRTSVIQQQQQREQAEPQYPRQRNERQPRSQQQRELEQMQQQREQQQQQAQPPKQKQREQQLQRERPHQERQEQSQPPRPSPREQELQKQKPQPQEQQAAPQKAKPKSKKQDKKQTDKDKEGNGGGGTNA